ncbi:MAG: nucleoside hydrolase [Candidatus Hydrogenedentota bacterium]
MRLLPARITICLVLLAISASAAGPVKLIFDTDMGNDVDDALALALIHEFADRGEAELLAVTLSKDNLWAAAYTDAVNTFYGRPDIPIGIVKGGKTPDDGKFVRAISERKADGKLVYPRDIGPDLKSDLPDATDLLRTTLAAQQDGAVTLVSVGFLTNVARLLQSKPDANSPLNGTDLAKAKVNIYIAMAGAFSGVRQPEYNVFIDAEASRYVFANWPTPLVASGFEIGLAIFYPAISIERDYAYVPDHPVAEAYRLYDAMPHDRPTWDLTAVLYAVRSEHGYFDLSYPGRISLNAKNVTEFAEGGGAAQRYLVASPEQVTTVRELFVHLVSSPPEK